MKTHLLKVAIFISLFWNNIASAQCPPGFSSIKVVIVSDGFAYETHWKLIDLNGDSILAGHPDFPNSTKTDSVCVPSGTCLIFDITDQAGDGICCGFGNGSYSVYIDGVLAVTGGQFQLDEKRYINCPAGSNCDNPFTAVTDSVFEATLPSTWYSFVPDSSGTYNITTCLPQNSCNTKIWVYDHCAGLQFDLTQIGTLIFNDDACGQQSFVAAGLAGGITYWIRVGADTSCTDSSIAWQITYSGPVVGCMDPAACNYNPLAIIDNGVCIYPGDPNCNTGPDLEVDAAEIESSLFVGTQNGNDACLIGEGCLGGYGTRQVLEFTTTINNIGDQDYFIGPPQAGNNQFVFDQCHGHWHYAGYAEYQLYDINQQPLQIGFKNGFCVIDLWCFSGTAKYDCQNMGISAGCADSYGSGLQCQWLDITDVPAGQYTLVVKVNWDHSPDKLGHFEQRYDNNVAYVCMNITRNANNVPSMTILPNCSPILDCAGEEFGLATNDCLGNCNGTRVSGDLDVDADRDSIDLEQYMNDIVNSAVSAPCNDLNGDNQLTVTDAARLNGCIRNDAGNHTHPGGTQNTHRHCQFPFNVLNTTDTVKIGIGAINTTAKYFDIDVLNSDCNVLGLELDVTGVIVDSVGLATPQWLPVIKWNSAGHIVVLAENEYSFLKRIVAFPMLRVYYSSLTSNSICITNVRPPVNADYEETLKSLFNGCVSITGLAHAYNGNMISVIPNPSKDIFTVKSEMLNGQPADIQVIDALGHIVLSQKAVISEWNGINIDLSTMNEGIYILQLKTKEALVQQKIILAK